MDTPHPQRWRILGILVISLLVVVLDNTILNVAMKTIADPDAGLGASQSELEWAINSYTLVFAGLLFTAGVLGDRYGRRRTLITGMTIFGIASLASAYAQDPGQLIAARALMGLGGAAIMPATLSIISNVFDARERAKAIGIWASAVGLAAAIGPIVGGVLLEHFWWGSVFLINVPIVIAGLIGMALWVPESRNPNPGRLDLVGVGLSVVGLASLVYGVITGGDSGDWGQPKVWGTIALGVAVLAAFVAYERRVDQPALDVRLFANPRFSAATAAVGLLFFAAMGVMFFMAFYLQMVRGYSPLETGLIFLPFAVAQLLFAPRSAALVKKYGPKAVCTGGLIVSAVGLSPFLWIDAGTPIVVVLVGAFLQGAGMANVIPPATEAVMSSLPREKAGIGSAVNNTVRQVGGALGVAVLGSVLSQVYRSDIAGSIAGLPERVRETAAESIASTYAVADQLGPAGARLIDPANDSFVSAMHLTAIAGLGVMVVAVAAVLRWLPSHSAPHAPAPPEPAIDTPLVDVG